VKRSVNSVTRWQQPELSTDRKISGNAQLPPDVMARPACGVLGYGGFIGYFSVVSGKRQVASEFLIKNGEIN
jgi:hypothetical protein